MTMQVAALMRFPVKSLGGEPLDPAPVTLRGLDGDRRCMVVLPDGRFVTRREMPAMARLHARAGDDGGLVLSDADGARLEVARPDGPRRDVTVWRQPVTAATAGEEAHAWLSQRLGRAVQLVHMPDDVRRPVDLAYGAEGDEVSFADGFPLLVTTEESLDALNAQLPEPVTMARFRPNLVIRGAPAAFAEDGWTRLRIGAITFRLVKPCTRCVVTTQDPQSGAALGPEPLPTLRAMGRVWERQPIFGVNAIPDAPGLIRVGDAIKVL